MKPIIEVARQLGFTSQDLIAYGDEKAKIKLLGPERLQPKGRLVLVTAMSPSPAGEGKTTTLIGLTDALNRIGKNAVAALREPSMGPVFGMKGGGAGGGRAQLYPSDEINLHFNGDFHAITAAHNLLAATVDNHIHFGNSLGIDVREPMWERVLDVNDRALREVIIGLGGRTGGQPRQARFDITAASEIMAVMALASSRPDLQERLSRLVVGRTREGQLVRCHQLKAQGSLSVILKDALLPNLVQTLEGSPAVVHAGPFGNIAHGTSSVLGTQIALASADFVLQEAGFGADLGGEKFIDIFCPTAQVQPALAVLVVTLRALRYHAGVPQAQIGLSDPAATQRGLVNPLRHIENLRNWGLEVVVAINGRPEDTEEDRQVVVSGLAQAKVPVFPIEVFRDGGAGALELAEYVAIKAGGPASLRPTYEIEDALEEKIEKVAQRIYRARQVHYSKEARRQLSAIAKLGEQNLRVCIAKTQYSFSDEASQVGAPSDFDITIREARLAAGAGFVVAVAGDIMTMPGLAKEPNLEKICLGEDGRPILY